MSTAGYSEHGALVEGTASPRSCESSLQDLQQIASQVTWLLTQLTHAPATGITIFDFNHTWLRQGDRFQVVAHVPETDPAGTKTWRRFAQPMRGPEGNAIGMLFFLDDPQRQIADHEQRSLDEMTALAQWQMHAAIMQAVQSDLINQIRIEQQRALIDPLTGIWNRAGVRQRLEQSWEQLADKGHTAIIAMADIDRFKRINDRWGHQAGDEVLKRVAQAMRDTMNPIGAVGRYGGEEFLVMVESDDARGGDAIDTFERLRQNVSLLPARYRGEEIRATISIGVVSATIRPDSSIDDMVRLADESLYCAKAQGRNRVVLQRCA